MQEPNTKPAAEQAYKDWRTLKNQITANEQKQKAAALESSELKTKMDKFLTAKNRKLITEHITAIERQQNELIYNLRDQLGI